MAYSSAGLTRMASGGGANIWFYRSTDNKATVNSSGYFTGDAVDMLNIGDLVIQQEVSGTIALPTACDAGSLMWVVSNNGTVVDVSDGTDVVVTDGD